MDIFDRTTLSLIVWPWNCDIWNFHLNNGDYLYLMDLGRIQMTWRLGLFRLFLKLKCRPVVGGSKVRYLKSLLPFQKFLLHTQVKGWDDKWLYIEHTLERKNQICTRTYIQACFRNKAGIVPFADILAQLNLSHLNSPSLPEEWSFKLAR